MEFFILFSIGLIIAILSIVIGSTIPVYIALMQGFFPTLSLGNIIGADKFQGFARGIGALPSLWSEIDWKFVVRRIPFFFAGVFVGASIISELSITWVPVILVAAYFVAEFATHLAKFFHGKYMRILDFLLGAYGGIIAASIKPMMLSVFRLSDPRDEKITYLRIQIQTIMFLSSIGAVAAHLFHGTILLWVVIPLACGNIIGGFIGGTILKRFGKLSGRFQKNVMRLSFAVGISTSIWMLYT